MISHFSDTIMAERRAKAQKKAEARAVQDTILEEQSADGGSGSSIGEKCKIRPHKPNPESEKLAADQARGIHILDALAATGLRSIRYLKEIPNVRHLTINDLVPEAVKVAHENCVRNGVDLSRVSIEEGDACLLMYQNREPAKRYDVIDLDPYGTAAPFLEPAVQAIADGGLLCVTCTDSPVLCGTYPEKCFSLYGSMPLRGKYLHEMSLRILLHAIDTAANKHKRHIVPWLSISVDFYVRVFVRVFDSPAEVKKSCLRRANVFQSVRCQSFYLQPLAMNPKTDNYQGAHIQVHPCMTTSIGYFHPQSMTLLRCTSYEYIKQKHCEFLIGTFRV